MSNVVEKRPERHFPDLQNCPSHHKCRSLQRHNSVLSPQGAVSEPARDHLRIASDMHSVGLNRNQQGPCWQQCLWCFCDAGAARVSCRSLGVMKSGHEKPERPGGVEPLHWSLTVKPQVKPYKGSDSSHMRYILENGR